ncbi:MAG: phosphoadenylyl-sulfate reductase [Anaerolineae bacterium]|nr:phosphoadenylyl-sulfate reductase [Anaerolineae bacterium]
MHDLDIDNLNEEFETWSTQEILRWAWETFKPHIATSSSFQTQSVPLLHLISQVCPEMPVLFIDTGFHFSETLAFRDLLQQRYHLNVVNIHPSITKDQLFAKYGEGLYRHDPDLCCYINKVEPMQRALAGLNGWIAGVRRGQTANRSNLKVLETQSNGVLKIHPLLHWTRDDLWDYINEYQLPHHPLYSKGYHSVGCAPCTIPVMPGQDERAGRWAGTGKTECGLHLDTMKSGEEAYDQEDKE